MGACLEPTKAMRPWYNVEISGDHAELGAPIYIVAGYRVHPEERAGNGTHYTDEEHAGAWRSISPATVATPVAPVSAILATLDQILKHPDYKRWVKAGGRPTPEGVRAERSLDGRLLLTAPFHRYAEDRDHGHMESVEILFADVAPLRDAIAALT